MAKPGQQIQSALMRDPVSRPLPASAFRKSVAPPQRFVPPKSGGILESGGDQPQRVGIGQFEQNQFNRPVPPALPVTNDIYMKPPPPGYAAGIVGGMNPALVGPYQPGQVGIGTFEQNQIMPQRPIPQPQPWFGSPMTGGSMLPTNYANASQLNPTFTSPVQTGPIQTPAMNQAAQIAQGTAAGIGQGLTKR